MFVTKCTQRTPVRALSRQFSLVKPIADSVIRPNSAPETVGWGLDSQVVKNHLKRCVRVTEHTYCKWSFGEVKRFVDAIATGLANLGFEKGHRLALALPNNPECYVSAFAAAKIGVVVVPLPQNPSQDQLEQTLASGIQGLIFADSVDGVNYSAMVQSIVPETKIFGDVSMQGLPFRSKKFPHLRHLINIGRIRAPGMLRYQWIGTYNDSVDMRRLTKNVLPSDPFLETTAKTFTQKEFLSHAQSIANFTQPLHSTATYAVLAPLTENPSALAGCLAAHLQGAMCVMTQSLSSDEMKKIVDVDRPDVLLLNDATANVISSFPTPTATPSSTPATTSSVPSHALFVEGSAPESAKKISGVFSNIKVKTL